MKGFKQPFHKPALSIDDVRFHFRDSKGNLAGEKFYDYACFATIGSIAHDLLPEHPDLASIRFMPQWSEITKNGLKDFYGTLMGNYFFFKGCIQNYPTILKDRFIQVSLIGTKEHNIFTLLSTLMMARYPDEMHPIVIKWLALRKKYPKKDPWSLFVASHKGVAYVNSNHTLYGTKIPLKNQIVQPHPPKIKETILESFASHYWPKITDSWSDPEHYNPQHGGKDEQINV